MTDVGCGVHKVDGVKYLRWWNWVCVVEGEVIDVAW